MQSNHGGAHPEASCRVFETQPGHGLHANERAVARLLWLCDNKTVVSDHVITRGTHRVPLQIYSMEKYGDPYLNLPYLRWSGYKLRVSSCSLTSRYLFAFYRSLRKLANCVRAGVFSVFLFDPLFLLFGMFLVPGRLLLLPHLRSEYFTLNGKQCSLFIFFGTSPSTLFLFGKPSGFLFTWGTVGYGGLHSPPRFMAKVIVSLSRMLVSSTSNTAHA